MAEGVVLGVGYGWTETVAVAVAAQGRWLPVRFDGADRLSSGVWFGPDGVLAGPAAVAAAVTQPELFDPIPLRWLQAPPPTDGRPAVWDMVTATLSLVAARCRDWLGATGVDQVCLVVPASWGPRRRTDMRAAAWRAGLGQPEVIATPTGVAQYALRAGGQVLVGQFVAVCDVDAMVEASVLRRTAWGFEVVSTIEAPDAGVGLWDAALVARLDGAAAGDGSSGWGVWSVARSVREAAASQQVVTVAGPAGGVMVLPADAVYAAGAPVVQRAGQVLVEAVRAAEIDPGQLAAVWCSGPGADARVAAEVAQVSGLPAQLVDQPRFAAVLGAAQAAGPAADALPEGEEELPTWRWLPAVLLPTLASMCLFAQFVTSASRQQQSLVTSAGGYLLAAWGELALAGFFALVAALASTTVFAAALPDGDPFDPRSPSRANEGGGRVAWWQARRIGAALVAAAGCAVAVAGVYAVVGGVFLAWPTGPFLRWALLPMTPALGLVAVAAVLAVRAGRMPQGGWHAWLAFPTTSVVLATVGMVLIDVSTTTSALPSRAFLLHGGAWVGGAMLGVGAVCAVVGHRWWRIVLGLPAALLFAATASWSTIGTLVCLYVAAASVWWARRVWLLATRPRTALSFPS